MTLNRAQIIGNLTRDPEVRTTPSGQSVANFGVATSSIWTDAAGQRQERTEFHHIVAWGKLADICAQYLGKGRKVFVEGRLQTREWETQDAQKRQRTEIVADTMIMLDKAPAGAPGAAAPAAGSYGGSNKPTYVPAEGPNSSTPPEKAMGSEPEIKVEDIPF